MSCCAATLLNAFQKFVEVGVLLTHRSSSAAANAAVSTSTGKGESAKEAPKKSVSVPLMALHPDWVPTRTTDGAIAPEGKLWQFVERLSRFRREGKKCVTFRTV